MSFYERMRTKNRKNKNKITESERILEKRRVETERIKNEALNMIINYDQFLATPDWIYTNDYYGQYTKKGELKIRCECTGCHTINNTPRTPDHCIYCTCIDCVCSARKASGKHSKFVTTAWWDNPCMGTCPTCQTKK